MKRSITLAFIVLLGQSIATAQNANSIFFDSGKSDLKPESEVVLKAAVEKIRSYADVDLRIEAFTDDKGSDQFNKELAQKRAETVRNYLWLSHIVPQKLEVRSIGELANDAKETDIELSRQKNRRVDISYTPIQMNQFADLTNRLTANSAVTQEIQPDKSATLNGVNGVKIEIPENAFMFLNGKPCTTPVKVTLREALTPNDWVLSNLSTVSTDGRIMSSGGMFNLEATADGKPVQFKRDKKAKISVPALQKPDPNMQLFYGAHDSTVGRPVGWSDNRDDWESSYTNEMARYRIMDSLLSRYDSCKIKKSYFALETSNFDKQKLRLALGEKPTAPYHEELLVPKIKNFDNIPLRKSFFGTAKEQRKRDKMIEKSKASFAKRMEQYEQKIAQRKQDWVKYRQDSADYVGAQVYLAECRAVVLEKQKVYAIQAVYQNFNAYMHRLSYTPVTNAKIKLRTVSYGDIRENVKHNFSDSKYLFTINMDRIDVGLKHFSVAQSFLRSFTEENKQNFVLFDAVLDSIALPKDIPAISKKIVQDYDNWVDKNLNVGLEGVNTYVGEIIKVGWVNIDVFYKYDAQKAQPVVLKEQDEARTYLVCKQINAILPMNRSKDKTMYGFAKVPAGLTYSLVAIKLKDGFPFLSIQNFTTLPSGSVIPEYKKVTVPELKEALAGL